MKKTIEYNMPKRPREFFGKEDVMLYLMKLEDENKLDILPENLLYFYVYDSFRNEVNNGGLEQYFFNCSANQCKYLSQMAKWTRDDNFIALIENVIKSNANDYESLEKQFYEISDKVEKSVKNAYKENYAPGKIAIEIVKERASDRVRYFYCDKKIDLEQALNAFLNFIEEFEDHNWNIEIRESGGDIRIDSFCFDKGLDLLEIISHFGDPNYSFLTHKIVPPMSDRINIAFFKNVSIVSTTDITGDRVTDYAVNITPSGFEKNEYKMKYSFLAACLKGDEAKPLKFHSYICLGDFLNGCLLKKADLEKVKEILLRRAENASNISNITYSKSDLISLDNSILLYSKD